MTKRIRGAALTRLSQGAKHDHLVTTLVRLARVGAAVRRGDEDASPANVDDGKARLLRLTQAGHPAR